jgi:tRNA threonylcarbamoyladenosine biosynthesis protein TsaB
MCGSLSFTFTVMPRAIALETSGRTGSVALFDDDRLVAENRFPHGLKHAAELIPMLDKLLKSQNWTPRDIERLYVSIGPGSFTGLRIGVTLAKTFAFATGARIVAVPSLQVLVRNVPADWQHAIVLLDAKRGQIFTARYANRDGRFEEEESAHLDTLAAMVARAPRPVYLLGEGLPFHEQSIPADDPAIIMTPPETWQSRASIVGQLGIERARRGEFTDPQFLVPLYIRLPEAEEKRLAAEGSALPNQ